MMQVRCGRCRTPFPVETPGRYACPACGAVNEVRSGSGPPTSPDLTGGGYPEPAPAEQSPRVSCPACSFGFIVGDIEVARCPNCGVEVVVEEARLDRP